MKQLTLSEALFLSRASGGPAISLYLDVEDTRELRDSRDFRRPGVIGIHRNLDRLVRNIEVLVERSFDQADTTELLASLKNSLRRLTIPHDAQGIGIYHKNGFTGYVKLPSPIRNLAVAAKSFHIKPVLRCAQLHRAYYMVLFRNNSSEIWYTHPDRLYRIAQFRWDKKQLDGQAMLALGRRMNMNRIIKKIQTLNRSAPYPILLAGPEVYQEVFLEYAPKNLPVCVKKLTGSIEHLDIHSIVRLSQNLMKEHFAEQDKLAVAEFTRESASGRTSTKIHEIGHLVAAKKVKTLFVAEDRHIWGEHNHKTGEIKLVPRAHGVSTDDILDDLAEQVFNQGQQVIVLPSVQMPLGSAIAATLRIDEDLTFQPSPHHGRPWVQSRPEEVKKPYLAAIHA